MFITGVFKDNHACHWLFKDVHAGHWFFKDARAHCWFFEDSYVYHRLLSRLIMLVFHGYSC